VRLCWISDHSTVPQTAATVDRELAALRQCAIALVQQGHQVYWVLSPRTLEAFHDEPALAHATADALPPTCQYVVPLQPYQYAGVQLFCVDQQVWQHPDSHTRLFTFLCLLQRALSCDVFHALGALSAVYLAIYTARFLGVPAVLSSGWQLWSAGPSQPFLWHWVVRHVSAAVVSSQVERQRLLTCSPLEPARIHMIDAAQPEVARTLAALYARLSGVGRS